MKLKLNLNVLSIISVEMYKSVLILDFSNQIEENFKKLYYEDFIDDYKFLIDLDYIVNWNLNNYRYYSEELFNEWFENNAFNVITQEVALIISKKEVEKINNKTLNLF